MKGRYIHPSAIYSPSVKLTWTDQTLWRPALDVPLSNIWFFSTRVLPLFKARRMNESGLIDTPLPPMGSDDILYFSLPDARRRYSHDWHQAVLNVATGGKIPQYVKGESWSQQWSPTNQVCFKTAVMTGAFAYVVRDLIRV